MHQKRAEEYVRKLRHYTRKIVTLASLREQRLYDLFGAGNNKETLNEKFIEGVQKRRDEVLKWAMKLYGVQVPLFAVLMLALLPLSAKVSVFGITVEGSRNVREIVVVVSALLGIIASLFTVHRAALAEIVKIYVERLSKGNKEVREFSVWAMDWSISIFHLCGRWINEGSN
jgi:hypothetical protein